MMDANTPKISVIVPVYGVEKYIGKCVCSLMEQSMTVSSQKMAID